MNLVYPLRHIFVTQKWGVNPQVYSQFGLKGHNGTDYRLFDESGKRATTALLYAPHDGKVIEARNDPKGYGLYLKIENDKQGSILGHLESFNVKVGQKVNTGQLIGVCDNTGFSTGSHLHWGYYPIPRDKSNGYSGTIDQEKLSIMQLSDWEKTMPDNKCQEELTRSKQETLDARSDRGRTYFALNLTTSPDDDYDNKKAVKRATQLVEFEKGILDTLKRDDLEGSLAVLAGMRSRITDLGNQLGTFQAEVENRLEQISRLQQEVLKRDEDIIKLDERLNSAQEQCDKFAREKGSLAIELAKAQQTIESLKAGLPNPPTTSYLEKFFELLTKLLGGK